MSDFMEFQAIVIAVADSNPEVASEAGGDVHCFYCGAWIESDFEPHCVRCIYIRAKKLVEQE